MSTPGLASFRAIQVTKPSKKSNDNNNNTDDGNIQYSNSYYNLAQYFKNTTYNVYLKCNEHVVQQVVQLLHFAFCKDNFSPTSIPTILINLSFRPSDNHMILQTVESSLEDKFPGHIIRFHAASTSAEQIKSKITDIILSSDHVKNNLKSSSTSSKSSALNSNKVLSHVSYAILAKLVSKDEKPIVIILEEIERMDSRNLSELICILSNNVNNIKIGLILATNCDFYSLHSSISIKARDRILLQEVKNQSSNVLFTQVMNQVILPGSYSLKFGPNCLQLLVERFEYFDSSIESVLYVIRAMLFCQIRNLQSLGIFCSQMKNTFVDALNNISSSTWKLIYTSLCKIQSLNSQKVPKAKSSLEQFVKEYIEDIDKAHEKLLKTLRQVFLFIYRSDGDFYLVKAFIECLKSPTIVKTPIVQIALDKLSSFTLEEIERSTKYYLNNTGNSCEEEEFKEIAELILNELPRLKESLETVKKSQSTQKEQLNLKDVRTRSCLQERLRKVINQGKEQSNSIVGTFLIQIHEQFVEILNRLVNPMSLPMSEVVYFDEASITSDLLFPPLRLKMMRKLKEKPKEPIKKNTTINMAEMFKSFTHSNASINVKDFVLEEGNKNNNKKAKLVIDDMEYIGLLARERSGRIKKLIWE